MMSAGLQPFKISKTQQRCWSLIYEALDMANTIVNNESKIDVMLSGLVCLKDPTPELLSQAIMDWNDNNPFDTSF